jgi:NAD(P)H-dependent flavin oxidoreductase YrpB (nitropropane dioxygenase family)
VRTTVLDQIQNAYVASPWPEPYDSVGAVCNQTVQQWEMTASPADLRGALQDPERGPTIIANYRRRQHLADFGMVHCGQGVGEIEQVEPAAELIERISREAAEILQGLAHRVLVADQHEPTPH